MRSTQNTVWAGRNLLNPFPAHNFLTVRSRSAHGHLTNPPPRVDIGMKFKSTFEFSV